MRELEIAIGNKNYSSWSLRGWLALRLTGAPFRERMILLHQSDSAVALKAASPSARVPALHWEGGTVWDSLAIAETLAEAFPAARLWPEDFAARAHARAISAEMHAGFDLLRARMPMNIRRKPSPVPIDAALAAQIARVHTNWREARERFGAQRAADGAGGPYLYGRVSIADAFYAPVVTRMRSYAVPLDPVCEAYAQAVLTWPAMQEWCAAARMEAAVIAEEDI